MEHSKMIGQRQEFLNKDVGVSLSAMIGYYAKAVTWNEEFAKAGKYDRMEVEFNISSCVRKLELDFDIYTKEGLENSIHKLDVITSVCNDFKQDLLKLYATYQEGIAYSKEVEKKKENQND